MKSVWANIITGWNFMKVFRVLAGLLVIYSGIVDNNVTFVIIGTGFLIVALLTSGVCCALYNPATHDRQKTDLNKIEYEELDSK
jgi:hypothetical protein